MKKGIFLLFTLIACAFVLASCTQSTGYMRKLQQVDSLMENNPQAAYDSLCLYGKEMERGKSQKISMRYRLLMAKAQNKLFLAMPSDSAFQKVVDYYESKGTSNDKMEAHYLMGCIYRDQMEAPRAIQSFQEAADCVDTLSLDCDYSALFRIYAQMEDIFERQNLWNKAYEANRLFRKYALKNGSQKEALQAEEMLIPILYSLGDTAKAIKHAESCARLYEKCGLANQGSRVLPLLINICIKKRKYAEAKHYMQIYETRSGLFNSDGDICEGYEAYYELKGLYLLGVHKLDSAEYYFRKLMKYNYIYQASRGLLAVANARSNVMDMHKYALLCEQGMDKILQENHANAVLQASSMYQFQNLQHEIMKQRVTAEKNKKVIYILMLALLVVICLIVFLRKSYQKHIAYRQKKWERLNDKYLLLSNEMNQLVLKQNEIKDTYTNSIQQRQMKIESLQEEMQQYKEKIKAISKSERKFKMADHAVLAKFKQMEFSCGKKAVPSEEDWSELEHLFVSSFPLTYEIISKKKETLLLEFRVCMLTRFQFSNGGMANLLQSSPASISNAKSKANKRLFGDKGASTLYYNMVNCSLS